MLGIAAAVAVIITAFLGKLVPTTLLLLFTVVLMVINRSNLRSLYLEKYAEPSALVLRPQYLVMALFFLVFIIGLGAIAYMHKISLKTGQGGVK
jgi:hypothetical protein